MEKISWKFNQGSKYLGTEPILTRFYEPIISATIEKIVKPCNKKVNNNDANNKNSPAKVNLIIQYQCLLTDNFIKQLKCSNTPTQPVVTN